MKERLIEIIRSVPITGKTYAEYVEALAERIVEQIYMPPYMRFEAKAIPMTLNIKFTEEKMDKQKQIEEIDCKKCIHFEACQIAFRNSKDLGIYDCTEEEYFNSTLDCDYYLDNSTYRKANEVAENAPKWISVGERLPEENGTYLVIGKSKTSHTSHFYKERKIYGKVISAHFSNKHVTHWMPLPEPPIESEDEG